jgi:ferredoxin, 2Fe-2S
MPNIVFIHPDGVREELEIDEGTSVMQGATSQGIDGIVAECGGNCMCATCHVYVEPSQLSMLPPMSEEEDALLDGTASERQPNSRLSCQIQVTPELDGLTLTLPERQV